MLLFNYEWQPHISKKKLPIVKKASLSKLEVIKLAQEQVEKRLCSVTVGWEMWKLFVLSNCKHFMKVCAAGVTDPWPYTHSLPASETHPAQARIHTHKHLQNKSPSIAVWTVNTFSRRCSLVETDAAAGSPTVDGIMSKSVSVLSCGNWKGTHPGNSALTQRRAAPKLCFCSLYCVQYVARWGQYSPADGSLPQCRQAEPDGSAISFAGICSLTKALGKFSFYNSFCGGHEYLNYISCHSVLNTY